MYISFNSFTVAPCAIFSCACISKNMKYACLIIDAYWLSKFRTNIATFSSSLASFSSFCASIISPNIDAVSAIGSAEWYVNCVCSFALIPCIPWPNSCIIVNRSLSLPTWFSMMYGGMSFSTV